jgi:hypothetical protein
MIQSHTRKMLAVSVNYHYNIYLETEAQDDDSLHSTGMS